MARDPRSAAGAETRASAESESGPRSRGPRETLRALRPREKLLARGPGALTRDDLLCLVLGSGNRGVSVVQIARRLSRGRRLATLAAWGPRDWRRSGVGPARAARLCAAFELGRRAARDPEDLRPRIRRPGDAYRQVRHLGKARREHLVGLYLDTRNGLLRRETLSIGSLNTTRTHPREILYPAIRHLAAGFILAHNHPSGSLELSPEDVDFTDGVRRAGELMGIELYDHLVIAGTGYLSMRELGKV